LDMNLHGKREINTERLGATKVNTPNIKYFNLLTGQWDRWVGKYFA